MAHLRATYLDLTRTPRPNELFEMPTGGQNGRFLRLLRDQDE
jgi:hypothetical protein